MPPLYRPTMNRYSVPMGGFLAEFKTFAVRGNVVDLAVAVVIGTAFGKIVSSLVDNIVMPLIGLLLGGVDLSRFVFMLGDATLAYGIFLQSIIDFVIIALAIFVVIKAMNALNHKQDTEPEKAPPPSREVQLLTEIRDLMQKQRSS